MAIPKTIDFSPKTKTGAVTLVGDLIITIDNTVEQGIASFPDASVENPSSVTLCVSEAFDSEDPADYETIEYTEKDTVNNQLKGITRAKAGVAREWPAGTAIAAYVPSYAYNQLVDERIIKSDTEPLEAEEGALWLDTSEDTYQGSVFTEIESILEAQKWGAL